MDLVDQLIDAAQRVVDSGAISANGHGNVSLRVPGAQEMYFTAGPSLRNHASSAVVRVGLDGKLLEGDLPPIQGAVVAMHTAIYADLPDVGHVRTGDRGSSRQLRAAGVRASSGQHSSLDHPGSPGDPARQPRGVGVSPNPELAIVVGGIVEEAAQAGINAGGLGGPVEIPKELRETALQRAMIFENQGTIRA